MKFSRDYLIIFLVAVALWLMFMRPQTSGFSLKAAFTNLINANNARCCSQNATPGCKATC